MSDSGKTVAERAWVISLGTASSRVLGLVRESVIAAWFPKEMIDAFQVAFVIPNLFRRLTAEGAFSPSVISVFSKIWAKGDIAESQRFARAVLGFSLIFLSALTVLGVFGANWLVWIAGRGFADHPGKFELTASLTRFMFPYIFLISLTALAMGLLNSAGKFFAPAFAPVLLNVAIIVCAFSLSGAMPGLGWSPAFALAIGVLVGGAAQVIFQIPSLKSTRLLVKPSLEIGHPGLKQALKLTVPMTIGAAAYMIGILIATNFASTLGQGAVAYFNFANRLFELPLAVLVMAFSTAALPSLAALRGQGKTDEMKATFNHSLRLALFVAVPATAGLIVLAEPIVAIVYQRGLFTYSDTVNTAAALQWIAVGTCSVSLVRQTVPVFYAMKQVWTPVSMTGVFIATYVLSAWLLVGWFDLAGLCMALALAPTVQAVCLLVVLRRRIGRLGLRSVVFSFSKSALASLFMGAAAWGISRLGRWEDGGNSPRNIAVLLVSIAVGMAVYAVAAYVLKSPELESLLDSLKRRARRKAS